MTLRCHRVFCVCGCVHVTSFPLSPLPIPWTQWERVEWRAVCESVYVFGTKMQEYRGGFFSHCTKGLQAAATVATVYKYIHVHNRFVFSGGGEEAFVTVYGPLMTPC